MDTKEVDIDESLYSRQQIMLGQAAMKRMAVSSVLISGVSGLGVEIAKNVALAGVKTLTLHDSKAASWLDLSTNFYLTPGDIGKNRAEACLPQVSQLNPYVKCFLDKDDLSSKDLSWFDQFTCVIITDAPLSLQIKINNYCRSKGTRFISADVKGVFTWAFCDFGPAFEIFDKNGEENKEVLISSITQANPGVVTTINKEKHGLEDGDFVVFREVQGMTNINNTEHEVKVLSPTTFSIGDTSSFPAYLREGIAAQIKKPIKMSFSSLEESLRSPSIVFTDFAKMESPNTIHIGMQALHAFAEQHNGSLPAPWSLEDATKFIALAKQINESMKVKVEPLNEDLLKKMAFTAQGSIVPLTSFTGGIVAQECLKALSGKYTPLNQWMYLDAVEVLCALDTDPSQFQAQGNRYDAQAICIGRDLCSKLADAKLFMIGCGAIGCEMLKNYAMLGLACGSKGMITVTDNDLVEKSNLNRQFLFRNHNLGKPKSEGAAAAVKLMNPSIKITAYLDKVGPDTEKKYSDEFFEGLDIVCNALDNVAARLYVDGRCVTNKRPLLESGTLGPKGHVQVIIPHKTESYGSTRDPPERDVPFCTLKSFPNQIEHCIEWARDFSFGGLFVSKPMQWNQLIEEKDLVERLCMANGGGLDLKIVRTALKLIRLRPNNFDDCVSFARKRFEAYYKNKTIQLLHNFPLDHKIDDKGTLFWSSPKRPPKILDFDWNDATHRSFILSMASLWAEVWDVPRHKDMDAIAKACAATKIEKFVPKQNKKIETDENAKKTETAAAASDDIEEILKQLAQHFTQLKGKATKLKPIEFEKDDDTNFHIDFIAATANLRARMYSIPEVERLKIKAIAGRIMPAIATTTATVSGAVSLELIKLVKGCNLDQFKNLFMNLALPFWGLTEPGATEQKKITSKFSYTIWDRWDVKEGDITLEQFIKYFETKYGLQVGGVFKGAIMIYVPMFPGHAKRKPNKMSALLKPAPNVQYEDLIVTFSSESGEDVSGPPIRFFFSK